MTKQLTTTEESLPEAPFSLMPSTLAEAQESAGRPNDAEDSITRAIQATLRGGTADATSYSVKQMLHELGVGWTFRISR